MKFINLIKAQMKETKSKHSKASILKLIMFFTIHNECYIKSESTTKTVDLMAKYVSANAYHMPIFRTLINTNFKNVKTYLDPIPWNKHWQKSFETHFYLNKIVNKSWMKYKRRYLYECISEHINVFQKDYIFVTRSKEEKLYEKRKVKHKIRHYITQLCMRC